MTNSTQSHSILAPIMRLWLKLRYQVFSHRYERLVLEQIDHAPFLILPQVFNPVLLRTGQFMSQVLASMPFENTAGQPIESVLDLGTGSGVGAVFAARRGATIIATDINPEAVRCVRLNALLNKLETQIEARQGDLFDPVAGQQFDLVCFNPPFYRGPPQNVLDHAWRGESVFERFAVQLGHHLTPHGQALLILSSDGDGPELLQLLQAQGFEIAQQAEQDLINERLTAYHLTVTEGA